MHHYAGITPAHSRIVNTKRPACKAKALLPVAAVLTLTQDEIHLVKMYRKMAYDVRPVAMSTCTAWAENSRRHVAPSLRLVVGGAA